MKCIFSAINDDFGLDQLTVANIMLSDSKNWNESLINRWST